MSIHATPLVSRALLVSALLLGACAEPSPAPKHPPASTHEAVRATLGEPTTLQAMEALLDDAGPITVQTVISARWESSRSGLINLAHERAASLTDGAEPVEISFHALEHPTRGLYVIDTGAAQALAAHDHPLRTGAAGQAFNFGSLRVEASLGAFRGDRSLAGVLLTHLHLDHVLGLPDVARDVPIFLGPGESAFESPFHALTQPVVDQLLDGRAALQEWGFDGNGAIDVLGDASLFALAAPGHSPGSVAYVARTPEGPVLFTGDVCHTVWGWHNDVEPGTFSHDHAENARSLAFLRALADRHPSMQVRLGHQSL
ncbi:metallo-beta-lactamase [Sorangium cellulosum]|uniref:Metallo-beta-lactamase n=1 Tax=Sorangium cellulosum TaxID=56 RepID=A0A4P2PT77_SORCE|nr:MBL fold metallo-hydrolase [Sorangium cellulosum]AUX19748.1 metallo-beta-lactamase [Sorangium cellulosum]